MLRKTENSSGPVAIDVWVSHCLQAFEPLLPQKLLKKQNLTEYI